MHHNGEMYQDEDKLIGAFRWKEISEVWAEHKPFKDLPPVSGSQGSAQAAVKREREGILPDEVQEKLKGMCADAGFLIEAKKGAETHKTKHMMGARMLVAACGVSNIEFANVMQRSAKNKDTPEKQP